MKMTQLELFNVAEIEPSGSLSFPDDTDDCIFDVSLCYTGSVDVSQLPQSKPQVKTPDKQNELVRFSWWCEVPRWAKMSWYLKQLANTHRCTIEKLDVDKGWVHEHIDVEFTGHRENMEVLTQQLKHDFEAYKNDSSA